METIEVLIEESQEVIQITIYDNQETVEMTIRDGELPVGFTSFNGEVLINNGSLVENYTAGEGVLAGEVCYLNNGKMYKANASSVSTCQGFLALCTEDVLIDEDVRFLIWGTFETTGLTQNERYHVSDTPGAIQIPELSGTTDSVTRCIGFALSETKFWFNPSNDFIINN